MRMTLPEQELVVKNCSQLLIRDTTCSMSSSTLPFLLRSSLFTHCFFHWLKVFSIAPDFRHVTLGATIHAPSRYRFRIMPTSKTQVCSIFSCPVTSHLQTLSVLRQEIKTADIPANIAHCHLLHWRTLGTGSCSPYFILKNKIK